MLDVASSRGRSNQKTFLPGITRLQVVTAQKTKNDGQNKTLS